jgi:hypothetical protein
MFEDCSLTVAYPDSYAGKEIVSVVAGHFGEVQLKAIKSDDHLLPQAVDANIPKSSVLKVPTIIQMVNDVFQDYALKHGRPPYGPTFDSCTTARRLWAQLKAYALTKLKRIRDNELRVSHNTLRKHAQLSDDEIAKVPEIAASDSEIDCKNEDSNLILWRRLPG